jgi:hypothetical protein
VGSQPLEGKRELSPSSYVKRPSWYEMKLMDAKEKETPRKKIRESRPSIKFPEFVALMCSIIDYVTSSIRGETDHQG